MNNRSSSILQCHPVALTQISNIYFKKSFENPEIRGSSTGRGKELSDHDGQGRRWYRNRRKRRNLREESIRLWRPAVKLKMTQFYFVTLKQKIGGNVGKSLKCLNCAWKDTNRTNQNKNSVHTYVALVVIVWCTLVLCVHCIYILYLFNLDLESLFNYGLLLLLQ